VSVSRAATTGVATRLGRAAAESLLDERWQILGTYNRGADGAKALAARSSAVEPAGVERVIDAAGSTGVQALLKESRAR
jgi:NAD(P)-dependent dehydrogenase (short-subunit alcohol dehydrogenase family)